MPGRGQYKRVMRKLRRILYPLPEERNKRDNRGFDLNWFHCRHFVLFDSGPIIAPHSNIQSGIAHPCPLSIQPVPLAQAHVVPSHRGSRR